MYDKSFFMRHEGSANPSSKLIVPELIETFSINSVVDFGCGTGWWLSTFKECGVKKIQGLDGEYVPKDIMQISEEDIIRTDLSKPVNLDQKFDLAMSLEVAEHLPEARADTFVETLCSLSDVIFFSAAIPGQGGSGHINEQWQSYWAEKFAKHDFVCFDFLRPKYWATDEVAWWYRQNALIYVNKNKVETFPILKDKQETSWQDMMNVIHPELFKTKLRYENPGFGKWIKMGSKALKKSLSKFQK